MVDVAFTDIIGNASPTLGGSSVMVEGSISHGVKSQSNVIGGNLTTVRYISMKSSALLHSLLCSN